MKLIRSNEVTLKSCELGHKRSNTEKLRIGSKEVKYEKDANCVKWGQGGDQRLQTMTYKILLSILLIVIDLTLQDIYLLIRIQRHLCYSTLIPLTQDVLLAN